MSCYYYYYYLHIQQCLSPAYTTEPAETTKDYILVNFLRIIIYFFLFDPHYCFSVYMYSPTSSIICACVYMCLYGACLNTVFMSM